MTMDRARVVRTLHRPNRTGNDRLTRNERQIATCQWRDTELRHSTSRSSFEEGNAREKAASARRGPTRGVALVGAVELESDRRVDNASLGHRPASNSTTRPKLERARRRKRPLSQSESPSRRPLSSPRRDPEVATRAVRRAASARPSALPAFRERERELSCTPERAKCRSRADTSLSARCDRERRAQDAVSKRETESGGPHHSRPQGCVPPRDFGKRNVERRRGPTRRSAEVVMESAAGSAPSCAPFAASAASASSKLCAVSSAVMPAASAELLALSLQRTERERETSAISLQRRERERERRARVSHSCVSLKPYISFARRDLFARDVGGRFARELRSRLRARVYSYAA